MPLGSTSAEGRRRKWDWAEGGVELWRCPMQPQPTRQGSCGAEMTYQNWPTLGGKGFYTPSSISGLPQEGTDFRWGNSLQLRQNLQGLTVEDCQLTDLPAAGTRPSLKGDIWEAHLHVQPKRVCDFGRFCQIAIPIYTSTSNIWECLFTHILPNTEFYQTSGSLPIWLGETWCLGIGLIFFSFIQREVQLLFVLFFFFPLNYLFISFAYFPTGIIFFFK